MGSTENNGIFQRIKGANLIWKFADHKVNVFGPGHIEKSHFKGVFGCIF
jgi:hypothetical protein